MHGSCITDSSRLLVKVGYLFESFRIEEVASTRRCRKSQKRPPSNDPQFAFLYESPTDLLALVLELWLCRYFSLIRSHVDIVDCKL